MSKLDHIVIHIGDSHTITRKISVFGPGVTEFTIAEAIRNRKLDSLDVLNPFVPSGPLQINGKPVGSFATVQATGNPPIRCTLAREPDGSEFPLLLR